MLWEMMLNCPKILAATAQTSSAIIAGSTIIGWGLGIVFVGYAGISEILPNKWRYAMPCRETAFV
jgi:hypothetical protein